MIVQGRSCDKGCKPCGAYEWAHHCELAGSDHTGILGIRMALGDVLFPRGIEMGTHIHVSGLSNFCADDTLRQAFIPFGMVALAQVLRDKCGHSLGLVLCA